MLPCCFRVSPRSFTFSKESRLPFDDFVLLLSTSHLKKKKKLFFFLQTLSLKYIKVKSTSFLLNHFRISVGFKRNAFQQQKLWTSQTTRGLVIHFLLLPSQASRALLSRLVISDVKAMTKLFKCTLLQNPLLMTIRSSSK